MKRKQPIAEAEILAEIARSARTLARREEATDRARDDLRAIVRAALAKGVSTRRAAQAADLTQPRIVQMMKEYGKSYLPVED